MTKFRDSSRPPGSIPVIPARPRSRRLRGARRAVPRAIQKAVARLRLVITMAGDATSISGFFTLIRIRLSQSRIGWLTTRSPIDTDVSLRRFGGAVRLRSHTTDISVYNELVVGNSYQSVVGLLDDVRTIVDLGANTGLAARWLEARLHPARLVCVEPFPSNYEVLESNLAAVSADVRSYRACIGGRERRVGLTTDNGEFAVRLDDDGDGDTDVITMAHLISDAEIEDIDLLKCDIEGAEWELFEHCSDWIDQVGVAVVECHDGRKATELVELLGDNGAEFCIEHLIDEPDWGTQVVTLRRVDSPA